MNNFDEITGFLEYLGDAIIITNDESQIVYSNKACLKLFSYKKQEIFKMTLDQLMSKPIPNHSLMVKKFIQSGSKARAMMTRDTMPCIKATGEKFTAHISIASVSIDGQPFGVSTIQDYSSTQAEIEQLESNSNQDILTNLYNRRYLEKVIQPDSRLMQTWHRIGVIYIDLNEFKSINDTYGHGVGDAIISTVSKRIKNTVRFDDLCFRVGGDEFLIFANMNGVNNPKEVILTLASKIRLEVIKPIKAEHLNLSVDLSAGCGLYPEQASNLKTLIDLADKAMYSAKGSENRLKLVE